MIRSLPRAFVALVVTSRAAPSGAPERSDSPDYPYWHGGR
jgi:hypothetical protein